MVPRAITAIGVMSLPNFDDCLRSDLLLNKRTETWNLIVLCNTERNRLEECFKVAQNWGVTNTSDQRDQEPITGARHHATTEGSQDSERDLKFAKLLERALKIHYLKTDLVTLPF